MQWDPKETASLVGQSAFPNDFLQLDFYDRLLARMTLVRRSGLSAQTLRAWYSALITTPDGTGIGAISPAMAAQIKASVQSWLGPNEWLTAGREINDMLRERRRDALVASLMAMVRLPDGTYLKDRNALFQYLLIDTEMGSCMLTSRLKQALNSVQTFVQRAILRLEPGVQLADDEVREW